MPNLVDYIKGEILAETQSFMTAEEVRQFLRPAFLSSGQPAETIPQELMHRLAQADLYKGEGSMLELVVNERYAEADELGIALMRDVRPYLYLIGKDKTLASQVSNVCYHWLRILYDTHKEKDMLRRAATCFEISPYTPINDRIHPPALKQAMAELRAQTSAQYKSYIHVRMKDMPRQCALRVQGRKLGTSPKVNLRLVPGVYDLQLDCGPPFHNWVYRVTVGPGETKEVVFDPGFLQALRTDEKTSELMLVYEHLMDWNENEERYFSNLFRILNLSDLYVVYVEEMGVVRILHVQKKSANEVRITGAALVRHLNDGLDVENVNKGIYYVQHNHFMDTFTREEFDPNRRMESLSWINSQTRDFSATSPFSTTSDQDPGFVGYAFGIPGLALKATSWALLSANQDGAALGTSLLGSALLTIGQPDLIPHQNGLGWEGVTTGILGTGSLIGGIALWAGGDTTLGPMLTVGTIPLYEITLLQLLGKQEPASPFEESSGFFLRSLSLFPYFSPSAKSTGLFFNFEVP